MTVPITQGRRLRRLFENGFFATTAIISAAAMMIVVVISYAGKYYLGGSRLHLAVAIFSSLIALTLLTTLGFRQEIKGKVSFLLLGTGLAVYGVESVLAFFKSDRMSYVNRVDAQRIEIAKKQGMPFDTRESWEVVRDLRRLGHKAYPVIPNLSGREVFDVRVNGRRYIPLGGIANTTTVNCNELGEYSIYVADEFGFNNPKGLLKETMGFDAVFLGDSFTIGACVPQGKGFVDLVRGAFPRTLNLGNNGSGPLFMLAALKEFLSDKRIKLAFWMFYEGNDLPELGVERTDEVLRNYLHTSFRQDLLPHQAAIDSALASWVDAELALKFWDESNRWYSFSRNLGLGNIRTALYSLKTYLTQPSQLKTGSTQRSQGEAELDLFIDVLREARSTVKALGGELIFVFLPRFQRYDNTLEIDSKDEILRRVASEGIGIVDVDEIFRRHGDPMGRFPFRLWGHYDEVGNSLIAKGIVERIR